MCVLKEKHSSDSRHVNLRLNKVRLFPGLFKSKMLCLFAVFLRLRFIKTCMSLSCLSVKSKDVFGLG